MSRQMMQPAPPSSQRSSAAHQRTVLSAVRLPPVNSEMSGIVSDTSSVGAMRYCQVMPFRVKRTWVTVSPSRSKRS